METSQKTNQIEEAAVACSHIWLVQFAPFLKVTTGTQVYYKSNPKGSQTKNTACVSNYHYFLSIKTSQALSHKDKEVH